METQGTELLVEQVHERISRLTEMGLLISAGHFNHVVISAAEVFMAMGLGSQRAADA